MEAVVRDWIERCGCTRLRRSYCPVQGADQPIKKAYVRRNEFVEGNDAPLKSRDEVQHARQLSKSKTYTSPSAIFNSGSLLLPLLTSTTQDLIV